MDCYQHVILHISSLIIEDVTQNAGTTTTIIVIILNPQLCPKTILSSAFSSSFSSSTVFNTNIYCNSVGMTETITGWIEMCYITLMDIDENKPYSHPL